MAEIADRDVLADVELEIAAAGGEHEAALDRRRPDHPAIDDALEMVEDRIAFLDAAARRPIKPVLAIRADGRCSAHPAAG